MTRFYRCATANRGRLTPRLNNIGSEQSGRARLSLGGQYNNLFDRDHSFTANYTTSPGNADNVRQYGVHYRAPIYRYAASFSAFYTHSKVDTGTIGDFFDVSGSGDFYGFNFNQILRNIGRYSHEWFAGIQDRSFENDVSFSGIPIGIDVRSRPVTVGYSGRFRTDDAVMGFSISYSRNWSAGAQNNQRVYAAARSEGDVEWDALGIDGYVNYYLPRDWIARGVIAGQYSDEALIAGEQFGLGGADSVRGFEERIVTGDTGLRLTAELWTPQLPFVPGLRGLVFADLGHRHLNDNDIGEVESDTISSLGLGVRYQWKDNVSFTLDYGNAIAKGKRIKGGPDVGNVKIHASLFVRY